MDKYNYRDSISSFLIEKVDDSLLIISQGIDSPLDHIYFLNKIISDKYQNLFNDNFNIYFDLLSYTGAEFNRYLKAKYSLDAEKMDVFNIEEQEINDFPLYVKKYLISFYRENLDSTLKLSRLTETQKEKIVA